MPASVLPVSLCSVVEGKRSPGVQVVWVARNRFAVLDKTHQVWVGVVVPTVHRIGRLCAPVFYFYTLKLGVQIC